MIIYSVYGNNVNNLDGLKATIHNKVKEHDSITLKGLGKLIIENEISELKQVKN